jgi:hypothetical protein
VYIVVGRLLIYLGMQFPLPQKLEDIKIIKKLHECDLCLGVWIYGILSFFLSLDILEALQLWYIPVLGELITGSVISYLVHIFILGWRTKHEVIVV